MEEALAFKARDMLDYIELLDLRNREKEKTFVTLSQIKPGDLVKSALCESSEPMIYLGTWFTKDFRTKTRYGHPDTHNLYKVSPKRAFFLIKSATGYGKFVFLNYPVTSKVILSMERTKKVADDFMDLEFNREYIDANYCQHSYCYRSNNNKVVDVQGYTIQRGFRPKAYYISPTKENIDNEAKKHIEERFGIKLAKEFV